MTGAFWPSRKWKSCSNVRQRKLHVKANEISLANDDGSFPGAIIAISFPYFEAVVRNLEMPKQTFPSLMADVGGYMGLFLGVSIWSIFLQCRAWLACLKNSCMKKE